MASIKRVLPTLAIAAAVLFSGSAGYCKAKSKPKTKPAIKVVAPVKWVTKNEGRFTYSVPSNWMKEDDMWYVGTYPGYDVAFECRWQWEPEKCMPMGDIKRKAQVSFSGIAATQYYIEGSMWDTRGILIVGDNPEADGEKLMVWASSKDSEWKTAEATLRKIIASLKIGPPLPVAEKPVSNVWVTKTCGRFSVSVPSDWIPSWGEEGDPRALGYESEDGEAQFTCGYVPGDGFKDADWKKGKKITISGLAAIEHVNSRRAFETSFIALIEPESDGSTIFVSLDWPSGNSKAETVLRKILATFKIAPGDPPSTSWRNK